MEPLGALGIELVSSEDWLPAWVTREPMQHFGTGAFQ